MGNGDLSTDLGVLAPASSARPEPQNVREEDAANKFRRRYHADTKRDEEVALPTEDTPAHQLDHLA